ncbi:hypothetical protein [Tenacibaculum ovolyticum]|uniref:hypothetical protein n=1 Tax=Tenacibaculum ovolyticum TaxID=104270 RepID=UPI0004121460|nr:hypothetical protein [Tenacibaculum ovolyticum]
MENHLGKYILILLILVAFGCKNKKTTKSENSLDKSYEVEKKQEHLSQKEIDIFKKELVEILKKKDTLSVLTFISFPYNSSGEVIKDKRLFIARDYDVLDSYFMKEFMRKEEVSDLQSRESFKEGNLKYIIQQNFPNIEFNVFFTIEKINKKILITGIDLAG